MRTVSHICRSIRRSVLIFRIRGNMLPVPLPPSRSDYLQQHRRAAWEHIGNRYFSVKDQERLAAAEDAETLFFQIWTEEESYGKWKGTGISHSLGTEKKEGFCTHFCTAEGYEAAVWAAEPLTVCIKMVES